MGKKLSLFDFGQRLRFFKSSDVSSPRKKDRVRRGPQDLLRKPQMFFFFKSYLLKKKILHKAISRHTNS